MKKKRIWILIIAILIIVILLIVKNKNTANAKDDAVTASTDPESTGNTVNTGEETTYVNDNIVWGTYGTSYKGQELKYCKIGTGENILFVVAEQHGWEDAWEKDGEELTKIANNLIQELSNYEDEELFNNWTIYVIPEANPDGILYGTTNYGIGRTTYEGYDMNRCYDTSNFMAYTSSRNYTGAKPFLAKEAVAIKDLMMQVKSENNGEIVVVDLHGWLDETIGTPEIGAFYNEQFNNKNDYSWGKGYLCTWAKESLRSEGIFSRIATS